MVYSFELEVAERYGLEEAIIIDVFMKLKSPITFRELTEMLPFWSGQRIARFGKYLQGANVIKKDTSTNTATYRITDYFVEIHKTF